LPPVFYPAGTLPSIAREASMALPTSATAELIRALAYGAFSVDPIIPVASLAIWIAVCMPIASRYLRMSG